MMIEFLYGDRVKWKKSDIAIVGTVVDERLPQFAPLGNYESCCPYPVAVLWDEPGEVWWENGENLELA